MNPELVNKALEIVGNPNVLVNLVSQRVRQITMGGSRPLVADTGVLGVADIVLLEIIEKKIGWVMPEKPKATRPPSKKRQKHWIGTNPYALPNPKSSTALAA